MDDTESDGGIETVERDKSVLKPPRMYKVLLLNDDYTTRDLWCQFWSGFLARVQLRRYRL